MQVAIQNFMPPNLALLVNTMKGSTIDQVGPILQKRLHDVNWNVRDSALEVLQVVTSIAEISEYTVNKLMRVFSSTSFMELLSP